LKHRPLFFDTFFQYILLYPIKLSAVGKLGVSGHSTLSGKKILPNLESEFYRYKEKVEI